MGKPRPRKKSQKQPNRRTHPRGVPKRDVKRRNLEIPSRRAEGRGIKRERGENDPTRSSRSKVGRQARVRHAPGDRPFVADCLHRHQGVAGEKRKASPRYRPRPPNASPPVRPKLNSGCSPYVEGTKRGLMEQRPPQRRPPLAPSLHGCRLLRFRAQKGATRNPRKSKTPTRTTARVRLMLVTKKIGK